MWAGLFTHVPALLPLRDARTDNSSHSSSAANNGHPQVVAREFGGPVHRWKGALRLKENPLHRKAKRAEHAFS
jgi:hypothetical protein